MEASCEYTGTAGPDSLRNERAARTPPQKKVVLRNDKWDPGFSWTDSLEIPVQWNVDSTVEGVSHCFCL